MPVLLAKPTAYSLLPGHPKGKIMGLQKFGAPVKIDKVGDGSEIKKKALAPQESTSSKEPKKDRDGV